MKDKVDDLLNIYDDQPWFVKYIIVTSLVVIVLLLSSLAMWATTYTLGLRMGFERNLKITCGIYLIRTLFQLTDSLKDKWVHIS